MIGTWEVIKSGRDGGGKIGGERASSGKRNRGCASRIKSGRNGESVIDVHGKFYGHRKIKV